MHGRLRAVPSDLGAATQEKYTSAPSQRIGNVLLEVCKGGESEFGLHLGEILLVDSEPIGIHLLRNSLISVELSVASSNPMSIRVKILLAKLEPISHNQFITSKRLWVSA